MPESIANTLARVIGVTLALALAVAARSGLGAESSWPTITREDLKACSSEINQMHKAEFRYFQNDMNDYCTKGSEHYSTGNCKVVSDALAESRAINDLDWYVKGNDHCDATDYPCFGVDLYNQARTDKNSQLYWYDLFKQSAAMSAAISPDLVLEDAAFATDHCVARIWVGKYEKLTPQEARSTPAVAVQPMSRQEFEQLCSKELNTMDLSWARLGQNGPARAVFYEDIGKMDATLISELIKVYTGQDSDKLPRRADTPEYRATNQWENCLINSRAEQLGMNLKIGKVPEAGAVQSPKKEQSPPVAKDPAGAEGDEENAEGDDSDL